MAEQTEKKLVKAIEVLADKIISGIKADEALKFTQAAANAANTIACLSNVERERKYFLIINIEIFLVLI